MPDPQSLLERAAEAIKRAAQEPTNGQRGLLMEEALRLHHLALEAAKSAQQLQGPRNLDSVQRPSRIGVSAQEN